MTPEELIRQQLDDNKSFIQMRAKTFCDLAAKRNCSLDSEIDAERSVAMTAARYAGKHSDVLNVSPAAAEVLCGVKPSQAKPVNKSATKDPAETKDKSPE